MGADSTARTPLKFFNSDQCSQIHRSALEILRKTEVKRFHPEALQLLTDAGCELKDDNLVLLPPAMAESEIPIVYSPPGGPRYRYCGNFMIEGHIVDLLETVSGSPLPDPLSDDDDYILGIKE